MLKAFNKSTIVRPEITFKFTVQNTGSPEISFTLYVNMHKYIDNNLNKYQ